ncbi:predicted protein [Chaetoceros tenuissimus]|uniref:Uncharacterized protein n=1 Tax=Chaetoceros tenuissimus TaxID=426638 RepID=A0AAD3D3C0_9STRA|nr:predicted protein [Chaetoceros tenuissimus]
MKRQKPGTIVSSAILGSSCPLFEPKFHEMEWLPTTASSLQEDQIQEQTSFGAGGAAKPDTPSGVCGQAHPFAPSYSNIPCCTDVGNFAVKILKTSSDFVSVYRSGMIKDTITGAAAVTATRERTSSTDKGKSSCLDDHNEQRCIEVTPLLDNADHSEVWDESNDLNLWQNFLNQQKSLLPNNLSELNSVFD